MAYNYQKEKRAWTIWKEAEERREIIKQRKAEKKAAAVCK